MFLLRKILSFFVDLRYSFLGVFFFPPTASFSVTKKHRSYPIILLPGIFATERMFRSMKLFFEEAGYEVYTPSFNMQLRNISTNVSLLGDYIKQNKLKKFIFIGHSLGGIIGLKYFQREPSQFVTFISIDTPYAGSWWAGLASFRKACRQLIPSSTFMKSLHYSRLPKQFYSIYSSYDEVVSKRSAAISGAKLISFDSYGHIGMLYDTRLFRKILTLIR